jgi:glycosyltransferase involved in cell wall biosynthesis
MIIIAMHNSVLGHGPAPNLKKYLLKQKIGRLVYIAHPLLFIKENYALSSTYTKYVDGRVVDQKTAHHWKLPEMLLYIKDFLYTCIWIIGSHEKVDIYFGFDNLNALSGLCLKLLGRVNKVIYYGIDYFPTRFSNPLLNEVYHCIDKICVKYCDETWNASPQMAKARKKRGMTGAAYKRQYTVPMGIWYNEVKRKPVASPNRFKLFFIGTLVDYMGLDLVIPGMSELVKKFPKIRLDIVGIGEEKEKLERLAHNLHLTRYIHFYGLLTKGRKREQLFQNASIGLAPFNTEILDAKVKNADPVKLKEYTAYGIPIIVTDAISNVEQIRRSGCGVIIPYNEQAFIRAVEYLFSDKKRYERYYYDALMYAKSFDWEYIFSKNLKRLHIL